MNHWKCHLFVAAMCVAVGPLVRGQSAPADAPHPVPTPAAAPAPADRAYLGVYIGGENDGGGVKLEQVVDGSPAAKAGLQSGDVITALGDHTIGNEAELREVIASHQAGEKIKVTFLRDGEKRRTSARLGKTPADAESAAGEEKAAPAVAEKSAKRTATQSAPKARTKMVEVGPAAGVGSSGESGPGYMGVMLGEDDQGRTTVSQVVEGSPAEKAGFKEGDVILAIDSADAGSADDLVKLVQSHHAGDKVTVAIERDGAKQKLRVKLGQKGAEASGGGSEVHGLGGGTIAVPAAPVTPEPPQAAPAPSKPVRMRGKVAAPVNPEASNGDAMRKEFDELRAQLEKTRREMEDLRKKCETQQRTIDAIRRALGGERDPSSMAAPASSPVSDSTVVFAVPASSGSMATSEVSFTAPEASVGGVATLAAPAECSASVGGDDCCAAAGEGQAVAECVAANGDGGAFVVTDGDGDGHTMVLQLDGNRLIKLEPAQAGHGLALGGGHALTLKPTGTDGTYELVIAEDGDEDDEGEEGGEQCEIEFEAAADDGGEAHAAHAAHATAVHQALLDAHAGKGSAMKVLNLSPKAKQTIVVKGAGVQGVGNGCCDEGCSGDCCSKEPQVQFKAAPVKGGKFRMGGAAPAGIPGSEAPAMRARAMRLPGGPAQGALPRRAKGATGPQQLFKMLGGGGSFTWKCEGPCEFKFGPEGASLYCQGSCEVTRSGDAGDWQEAAPQPGMPGIFQLLGTGAGDEESDDADEFGGRDDGDDDDDDEEGEEEDDDDDASAPQVIAAVRVF